jgi:hypothetical protein
VKSVINGVTTIYIGDYFEWRGSTSTMKRYYYAGGERVAMRSGSTLYFLLGDHLGSTSVTATSSGSLHSRQLYKPWGYILSIGKMDKRRASRAGEKPVKEKVMMGQDARPDPE